MLAAFRKGKVRTLVATDIAARGIDVDGISHVVNFDLPNVPETYVHRIGRTARAGAEGMAISLCDAEEVAFLRDIEKLIRMTIPVSDRRSPDAASRIRGPPIAERANATPTHPRRQRHSADTRRPATRSTTRKQPVVTVSQTRPDAASLRLPSCIASAGGARAPLQTRDRVGPVIQKDRNVPKEELLQFEGLVTEILPDARYRVQLDNGHRARRLHRRKNEKEPDQDACRRSGDGRGIAL